MIMQIGILGTSLFCIINNNDKAPINNNVNSRINFGLPIVSIQKLFANIAASTIISAKNIFSRTVDNNISINIAFKLTQMSLKFNIFKSNNILLTFIL